MHRDGIEPLALRQDLEPALRKERCIVARGIDGHRMRKKVRNAQARQMVKKKIFNECGTRNRTTAANARSKVEMIILGIDSGI